MATNYRAMARRAAERYGLDPNIFERQIGVESINYSPAVISGRQRSPAGAIGIAQIMPDTAKAWGVDPLNPKAALNAAAKNMARYVKQYGSYEKALRAYNAGPGAIERSKGYAETNNYVAKILRGKDPKKLNARSRSSASTTTRTTPGTVSTSTITTGGQTPQQELPERERPTMTAPALPDYVTNPPPQSELPDRSDPQRQIRAQGAQLGNVPETTYEQTVETPSTTTTTTTPRRKADASGMPSGSGIRELFWQGQGGINIKNGKRVPQGFVSGHTDHVHVAAGPKTVVALGKIAQNKYGLNVRENPAFDPVDPVHTEGSYHYRNQAIDVSGDPAKMAAFARYVNRYSKSRQR